MPPKPAARRPSPRPPARPSFRGLFLVRIIGIAALVVVLGATLWLRFGGAGASDGLPSVGGPFTLTDGAGQQVTDRSYRGKYMLVYFGYTYCPDVCPTTLQGVAAALDKIGKRADEVQPLFITVDPRRDTPAAIAQYTRLFTPRLIGLTGTDAEIAQVAKEYRVYYAVHRTGPGPDDYSMDHSSLIYLMAPNGHFLALLHGDDPDTLAADLNRLIS
jgi:protein SCO1/2